MSPSNKEALARLVAELRVKLPSDYVSFLEQYDGKREIHVQGDQWILYTVQELMEPPFNRMKPKSIPTALYMRHFIHHNGGYEARDQIEVIDQPSLSAGQVAEMLCIGYCCGSADYLLLDNSTRKIFAFYTDGFYLEHCTNSFQELLQLPEDAEEE